MFSTLYGTYFSLQMHFKMSCAIPFNLNQSKILLSGNWLRISYSFFDVVSVCISLYLDPAAETTELSSSFNFFSL